MTMTVMTMIAMTMTIRNLRRKMANLTIGIRRPQMTEQNLTMT